MSLDSLEKIVAISATILGGIFGVAYFLIEKWFEAEQKIKEMESQEVLIHVTALESQLKDHKLGMATIWKELKETQKSFQGSKEQLVKIEGKIETFMTQEKVFISSVEQMKSALEKKVGDVESTISEFQMVPLGHDTFMLKGRKKSSGDV